MSAASASPHLDQPASEPSFDDVYRAHARQVARWAARLGGPSVDVDEAVQNVFLVVSRRLGEFAGRAKLTTWLFRITARVVANQRRAARRRWLWRRLTSRIADETPGDGPGPGDALEQRQAAERIYRALDALPERHRQVLVLHELEDLGTDEIARLLDCPRATVRVRLHRARTQLAACWERQQPEREEDP
jgi:RNA polymerase sigma-70 factor (ECF subfamily)